MPWAVALGSASGEWASRKQRARMPTKGMGEDKSCTAGGFAGSRVSYVHVLSENEKPNQQMKEFAIEMGQQRVCHHASRAKAERSVRQEWERVAEKMDSQQAYM